MTNPQAFDATELRLRAALLDLRPPDGPPSTLGARVDAIPDRIARPGSWARIAALVSAPAAIALVVSVAAIGLAINLARVMTPGDGGPGTGLDSFDPVAAGTGLVRIAIPALQVVAALSMLAAILLVRRWRSIGGFDTWRDMGRGLALIVLVLIPGWLLVRPPLRDYGGSLGGGLGLGASAHPPFGSQSPEVRYVTAERGTPFIAFFDVTNGSALPVTLEGLVVEADAAGLGPRWTSLALASVPNAFPNSFEQLRPFTPQVIAPNDRITLYLVGRAGSCAFGSGFTIDTPVESGETLDRTLQLSYSVLGLASTSTFTIPFEIVQPDGPCN